MARFPCRNGLGRGGAIQCTLGLGSILGCSKQYSPDCAAILRSIDLYSRLRKNTLTYPDVLSDLTPSRTPANRNSAGCGAEEFLADEAHQNTDGWTPSTHDQGQHQQAPGPHA